MSQLLEVPEIRDVPEVEPLATVKPPPVATPLTDLVRPKFGQDPNELLQHRFLCRGGGLLLVGPTGIGKSSLVMQMAVLFALGRECFGIKPTGPLKSLLIQAENDHGDLAEMRDGVIAGLGLTEAEAKAACDNVMVFREDARTGLDFFISVVRPLLEENKPHLLWIDPALAYLGGEANSQKDVGSFLRNYLNPLVHEFNCGVVVVHHTNKPATGREKPNWQAGDFAYLGGGSAEWANWARAVLAVRSLGDHSVFALVAAKRGRRLGWKQADGETTAYVKLIAHSKKPGEICWCEAEESERPAVAEAKRKPTKEDIMPHVPVDRPIEKETLRKRANLAGIALNKINSLITELLEERRLHEWKQKRPGTNPLKLLARIPQPPEDLLESDTHTET